MYDHLFDLILDLIHIRFNWTFSVFSSRELMLTYKEGTGEALRGTLNQTVDEAFGSKEGAAKNQQVTNRGLDSMTDGKLRRADHEEARLGRKLDADVAHTSKNV